MRQKTKWYAILLVSILVLAACGSEPEADGEGEGNDTGSSSEGICYEEAFTSSTGLKIQDSECGDGDVAEASMEVTVHYTGKLEDGTVFDSSVERGQPFTFVLGAGMVISGWDEGVEGMAVGGKRTLTIPPELGYGAAGAGNVIPPNATLIFDIELIEVKESGAASPSG
jgi:FKBP-type peptidyl-prolyl cis-trans isomerase